MAQRRHHYDRAFEAYLRAKRMPYIAVDEAKKALLPGGGSLEQGAALKSFDFVVYAPGVNLLVDVKGRKVAGGPGSPRLESWATRDDVASLRTWAELFGAGFEAALVFVYWCEQMPRSALFEEVFEQDGRWYALRSVGVDAYERAMTRRSERWGTVHVAREAFERISSPLLCAPRRVRGVGEVFGSTGTREGPATGNPAGGRGEESFAPLERAAYRPAL